MRTGQVKAEGDFGMMDALLLRSNLRIQSEFKKKT